MYYVYILRMDDNSLYTGITTDIKRRYEEHKSKSSKAAAYTRSRNVVSLEAVWEVENRSEASKLEYQIKKMSKERKEKLIMKYKSEYSLFLFGLFVYIVVVFSIWCFWLILLNSTV